MLCCVVKRGILRELEELCQSGCAESLSTSEHLESIDAECAAALPIGHTAKYDHSILSEIQDGTKGIFQAIGRSPIYPCVCVCVCVCVYARAIEPILSLQVARNSKSTSDYGSNPTHQKRTLRPLSIKASSF
jgi:hypothetical protein